VAAVGAAVVTDDVLHHRDDRRIIRSRRELGTPEDGPHGETTPG
jgi:hypothetical protein